MEAPVSPAQASEGGIESQALCAPLALRKIFPHARFVFPTAPRTRATKYGRSLTHQWFDNWTLEPPATEREELQIDGLRASTAYLHELLRAEIALLPGGTPDLVFGGVSQGCAAALTAFLLWEGEALGAVVGMCGYLPFAEWLIEQMSRDVDSVDDDFDPFQRDSDNDTLTANWSLSQRL